ncbi:NAD(P)H-dependent FMN reductase [Chitinophaga rupis]|uniref:NAD(P)H-dependent FMN reductase n=1 Tax=Chitinophaga rupis TaxID=573321 RepID=A0A1H7PEN3_9BACT|nr:NAD(P)H-dependent oxidoreductase [Chitinophaga rupis]SEL34223.1 NAD(P)H-dependent FMN reductase [Chitinophaga rupis]
MADNKKILIINGSVRGKQGNSGRIAAKALAYLDSKKSVITTILTLTDPMPDIKAVYNLLAAHDGFLVITGVYWNNWSSPLQKFIEIVSVFENSPAFFGKPVTCAVSMDSVGGIEIAGRLHAVFSGLGCWSPPCSTLVISRVGQAAVDATKGTANDPNEDVWRLDDIKVVLDNLVISTHIKSEWISWPHAELSIAEGPWPDTGAVDLGSPKFL